MEQEEQLQYQEENLQQQEEQLQYQQEQQEEQFIFQQEQLQHHLQAQQLQKQHQLQQEKQPGPWISSDYEAVNGDTEDRQLWSWGKRRVSQGRKPGLPWTKSRGRKPEVWSTKLGEASEGTWTDSQAWANKIKYFI